MVVAAYERGGGVDEGPPPPKKGEKALHYMINFKIQKGIKMYKRCYHDSNVLNNHILEFSRIV